MDITKIHPGLSTIFDGTIKVCVAMVIVLRFIDADLNIHQKLAALKLAAKSLSGE